MSIRALASRFLPPIQRCNKVFRQEIHVLRKLSGDRFTFWRWKQCRNFCSSSNIEHKSRPFGLPVKASTVQGRMPQVKQFVPMSPPPTAQNLDLLCKFIEDSQKLVVLTGAGISTESGIPDYRSPKGAYSTGYKPTTHQEFMRAATTRRRYWARSYVGWKRFVDAFPGATHQALAQLEERGRIIGMITQNVDRLHHKAGSCPVELHGTSHMVVCMDCNDLMCRGVVQERMKLLNPEWAKAVEALEKGEVGSVASFGMQQRPDGDIEIGDKLIEAFQIPECNKCGGILKPDVVFFGDNVPHVRMEAAKSMVKAADSLLVVGSSVMVFSAFRLVKLASDYGLPIAILNIGPTRADELAYLKVEARCGEVLPRLLTMGSLNFPTL